MNIQSTLRHTSLRRAVLLLLLAITLPAGAQTQLPAAESAAIVDSITSRYSDWSRVELNGKLSMSGLPVSPSVRFYMEKDTLLRLSMRVPLMGEVGRLEVDADSIMVVNKLNKTFSKEPTADAMKNFPTGLAEIQDLLLGRIFLLGSGTLRSSQSDLVTLYSQEEGATLVVPVEQPESIGTYYGFQVGPDYSLTDIVVNAYLYGLICNVTYTPTGFGTDILISLINPDPVLNASLSLDAPRWGAYPMEPFTPGARYTRLPMKEFVKKLQNH